MKKILLFLLVLVLPSVVWAVNGVSQDVVIEVLPAVSCFEGYVLEGGECVQQEEVVLSGCVEGYVLKEVVDTSFLDDQNRTVSSKDFVCVKKSNAVLKFVIFFEVLVMLVLLKMWLKVRNEKSKED